MKRKRYGYMAGLCLALILAGCGSGKKETEAAGGKTEAPAAADAAEKKADSEETTAETSEERELTREELQSFTDWIQRAENYGFLLSEYRDPKDADLGEIFYSGAGIATEPLTDAERQEYLEVSGQDEIYTDCLRLTTEQINSVLEKKLGCSLDEMNQEFPWFYLEKAKVWVTEHGDTNYANFTCVGGKELRKGVYELECVPGDASYRPYLHSSRLTVEEQDGDYRILSNVYDDSLTYSRSIYRIDNQSFKVDLGGSWGEVIFTSYAPNRSDYGYPDVSFSLVQDNAEIYDFPSVTEDNYRDPACFREVLAVSFQDYNGDGWKDVITICEYENIYGEAAGEHFKEVRLYQNMGYSFRLDTDKMDYLNANNFNNTIDEVMQHIPEAEEASAE